jgi:UrcA family protein
MKLIMFAAIALAAAASAERPTEIVISSGGPSAYVQYSDADLQSDASRTALVKRIKSAADRVCSDLNVEPAGTTLLRRDCYRTAIASGASQMAEISEPQSDGGGN